MDAAGHETALIEHYDGASWSTVSAGQPDVTSSELFKATPVPGSSALWAVGDYVPLGPDVSSQPLIEHWNGTAWTVTPTPTFPGGGDLKDVTAINDTNAWAVGDR